MAVDVGRWHPLVERVAGATHVPGLDRDDRTQEGWVGCLKALASWDADKGGVTGDLTEYVAIRIRWAVIDAARRHNRYRPDRLKLNMVTLDGWDMGDGTDDARQAVDEIAVGQAIVGLPDRAVLEAWAFGRTLADIGAEYGVTESRACQRFRRGCVTLARRLGD